MTAMTAHPTGAASARFVTRNQLADDPAWQRCLAGLCKDHRYYEIIEQTLANDFEYHYLVLGDVSGKIPRRGTGNTGWDSIAWEKRDRRGW